MESPFLKVLKTRPPPPHPHGWQDLSGGGVPPPMPVRLLSHGSFRTPQIFYGDTLILFILIQFGKHLLRAASVCSPLLGLTSSQPVGLEMGAAGSWGGHKEGVLPAVGRVKRSPWHHSHFPELPLLPPGPSPFAPCKFQPVKLLVILQSPPPQQSWKLQYHEIRASRYCWLNRGRLQPGRGGSVRQGQSLGPRGRAVLLPPSSHSSPLAPGPSSALPGNGHKWAPTALRQLMALL